MRHLTGFAVPAMASTTRRSSACANAASPMAAAAARISAAERCRAGAPSDCPSTMLPSSAADCATLLLSVSAGCGTQH